MTLDPTTVGTPQQPVIPPNQIAEIGTLGLTVPSAAGVADFNAFFFMVYAMNPGVFPSWVNAGSIQKATTLTNAMEQEWAADPKSGHNDPSLNPES